MPEALLLRDLDVRVGGLTLVHSVSLSLQPGESVALLGHSGSGKSLTAAAITGGLSRMLDATGELVLDGTAVDVGSSLRPAGCVAAVQQDSSNALNPLVRVARQLEVPLRRRGLQGRQLHDRAAELLDACSIDDPHRVLRSYPAELSGGQRQRACIALALACEAKVLVADEPTTALDVVSQAQVLDTLAAARERAGLALLFITHDLAAASQICDRAVVLQNGRIVEQGTFRALVDAPQHPYTRELVDLVRSQSMVGTRLRKETAA
ncbi:ATP-binding cassette domain-containing protein [Microbacterium sp.]|uniref:ATP-binding cassette domain-containing protein n=1 Tax=Microbacterium sp. TaxID=51671 RepID=UPI003C76D215